MSDAYFGKNVTSAEECAKQIASGDVIWLPPVNSAPNELVSAIARRYAELEGVHIWSALQLRLFEFMKPGMSDHIKYHTLFMGALERKLYPLGAIDVHSVSFEYLEPMFHDSIRPNVLVAEVSEPDEHGHVCFGPSGGTINHLALKTARTIILQVNPNVPFIHGERNGMNIRDAHYICTSNEELIEIPPSIPTETEKAIAERIIAEIPDGACIQLGLGGLSESIGYGLVARKNLGVHTEMFTQSMKDLMENGVITNSGKRENAGVSVIGFGLGNRKFYEFLHNNRTIRQLPINEVNHPLNIMRNDAMISINSCVSVDLTGQVTSEGIGNRQISGTGGALDYVKGANFAKNGKAFMVLESSKVSKSGERVSNILGDLPEGTPITIPRSETDYVVTEYGIAHVKNMTLRERAIALVSIAHPKFRKYLANHAITKGLIKEEDLKEIAFEKFIEEHSGEMVAYRSEDGICTITLNDDGSLNALGSKMQEELLQYLETADLDPFVSVVILTGAGRGFSSGGNIKEMLNASTPTSLDQYAKSSTRNVGQVTLAIRNMLKPVVAKVRGSAAGAGMNIALACDFRIVSNDSKFIEAFVNIGLLPDAGGISLLSRIVGPAKATELIFLGGSVSPKDAEHLGLVTRIVPGEDIDAQTQELAEKLRSLPSQSLRKMKDLINQDSYSGLAVSIDREVEGQRHLAQTRDFGEGVNAFIQKRRPFFQGR
jgi:4-hydroxybutyrate CoA-transferase